ncbi:MAG TPA: mannonate dehydratase [Thermomicrobiales bacterium]|jgi:mannonate dehydratase|nr:mannonate dehydratase [Thermomicrobiales bacterium]
MRLAEVLPPTPNHLWTMANQLGVEYAVSSVPGYRRDEPSARPSLEAMLERKQRFADHGIKLEVLETAFPMLTTAKWQTEGADVQRQIDEALDLIRIMGEADVRVACWNWMAVFNWTRTALAQPTRGGAVVTAYNHAEMGKEADAPEAPIAESQLWEGLHHFMEQAVPVAEAAGVTLALHPDDPPISPIRGVGRILTSPDNLQRAIDLVPSPINGLTFCQGTIATMGADVPAEIRRFGGQGKVGFVHFRDVRGTPDDFAETFHDDGQTDMAAAMEAWYEVGYDGTCRPDHVPTMAGEELREPGYDHQGRLYAIGYVRGLMQATARRYATAGVA